MGFDLFVALRWGVAHEARETHRGWMFYVGLLYTSPVWMTLFLEWYAPH